MDKFLYPTHSVRFNNNGPSECGKKCFLTNSISKMMKDFEKIDLLSTSTSRFI